MLTGRIRRGQQTDLVRASIPMMTVFSNERRIDAIEELLSLAQEIGIPITHLAMAFAIAHPGVTSALVGAHSGAQLDDVIEGFDVVLTDEILDRIDSIVPPGTEIGRLDQAHRAPAIENAALRRRPLAERAGA